MPLELLPTIDDLQIPQIEEHLKGVRTRRLLMQIEYKKIKNIKLAKELNKIEARLEREVNHFQKELVKLMEYEEKCKNRMSVVQILVAERGFTRSVIDDE